MNLPDSAQVRLKRIYPGAHYRATTATVQVPIPRAGGVGAQQTLGVALGRRAGNVDLLVEQRARGEDHRTAHIGAADLPVPAGIELFEALFAEIAGEPAGCAVARRLAKFDSLGQVAQLAQLFQRLEADAAGTIKAILVENGEPVEYGEPLFIIG